MQRFLHEGTKDNHQSVGRWHFVEKIMLKVVLAIKVICFVIWFVTDSGLRDLYRMPMNLLCIAMSQQKLCRILA